MKRIVFFIMVVVVALATSCNNSSKSSSETNSGPGNFNPEEMVDRQVSEMNEALDLSADQEKKVRELISENFEAMKDMRNNKGDRDSMREKMQQMRAEQNTKMKAILSDKQWEKYETIESERRGQRGQGRQGGGQGRPE